MNVFHGENQVSREIVQAPGKRPYRRKAGGICGTCRSRPRRLGQGDCHECHAAANREYRARVKALNNEMRERLAQYEKGTIDGDKDGV